MYFPIFIDLSQKEILVVGAGKIAARRVRSLCGFAGKITVVAPRLSPEIVILAQQYEILLEKREFQEEDLEGKELVLAATDDKKLNQEIGQLCRKFKIPVNVCSDQNQCDFQFPSVVQAGDLMIGINASGKDHRLVKETRKKIEECLGVSQQDSKYTER